MNSDSIKLMLLQLILAFICKTNSKFNMALAVLTGFNNALEELKTTHKVDTGENFQEEILREILFYNL